LDEGRPEAAASPSFYLRLRGVQYAEHPVGDLRWRPPARKISEPGKVHDATQWGPDCIQGQEWYYTLVGVGIATRTSEGCLFLNVWAPERKAENLPLLPILFWIHGGAFREGGTTEYPGDGIMATQRDAIYITANYRLGALGFLGGSAVAASSGDGSAGNFGLQDTREALRWVQRNARALGGDPARVTIFGESSGASLVAAHLVAPRSFGLFSGALMESGPFDNYTVETDAEACFREFAHQAGCSLQGGNQSGEEVLACLRRRPLYGLPWQRSLIWPIKTTGEAGLWGPVIDSVELAGTPEVLAAKGVIAPVRGVMLGTNANEGRYMMPSDKPVPGAPWTSEHQLRDWLQKQWPQYVDEIIALYPASQFHGRARYWEVASKVYTDSEYTCPTRRSARWLLDSGRVSNDNVFVYQLLYEPSYAIWTGLGVFWWNWCKLLLPCRAMYLRFGAAHGVEVPLVWAERSLFNSTDAKLSRRMVEWWQRFAGSGTPGSAEGTPNWHAFGLRNETMTLSPMPEVVPGPRRELCDFWDAVHRVPYGEAARRSPKPPIDGPEASLII